MIFFLVLCGLIFFEMKLSVFLNFVDKFEVMVFFVIFVVLGVEVVEMGLLWFLILLVIFFFNII